MRGGVAVEPGAQRRGSEWAEKEVLDDRDDASPRTAEHRRLTDAMHLNKVCEKMKMFVGFTVYIVNIHLYASFLFSPFLLFSSSRCSLSLSLSLSLARSLLSFSYLHSPTATTHALL